MSNPYYVATGNPGTGASGLSATMRTEFSNIQAGFAKLPDYTTAPANALVVVNSNNTGFTTTQAVVLGGSFTTSGAFNLTLTLGATVNLTLPSTNDTLVGRATTDTLTNKTFDTAGAGNVFKINGVAISAVTGTGSAVLATSPTLVTPVLGVATCTTINGLTISTSTGTLTIANGVTVNHGATHNLNQALGTISLSASAVTILALSGLLSGVYAVHIYCAALGNKSDSCIVQWGTAGGVAFLVKNGTNWSLSGSNVQYTFGSSTTCTAYYTQMTAGN